MAGRVRWFRALSAAVAALPLLLLPGSVAATPPSVVLTSNQTAVALGPAMELLVDPTGRLGLADVLARTQSFRPITAEQVALGTTRSAFWLRFCVQGSLASGRQLLSLGPSRSLLADLYRGPPGSCDPRDPAGWQSAGVTALHGAAPGHPVQVHPRFELPTVPDRPTPFYLRVEDRANLLLVPRAETPEAFLAAVDAGSRWHGAYYGMMLAILAINLLVFVALRDPRYLWYVAFQAITVTFFYGVQEGILGLTGPPPEATYELRSFTIGFVQEGLLALLATQFSRRFLDTARHAPRLDRLLRGYLVVVVAAVVVGLACDEQVMDWLANGLGLAGVVVFLPLVTLVPRQPVPNTIFFAAWGLFLGGILFNVATQQGWVPFSTAGSYSYQAGSALQGILMTFALAERIWGLRRERDRRVTELEQANASLQRSSRELRALGMQLAVAEERERRRLAQELHDHTGQSLAAAWMKLQTLQEADFSAPERRLVEECRKLIGEVLEQVRHTTFDLSSPLLFSQGLAPALRDLATRMLGEAGVQPDFSCQGDGAGRSTELDIVLYQLARELLRNVVKHAGASAAEIVLLADAAEVSLMVTDDGVGFDPGQAAAAHVGGRHFGLLSVRERVEYLGGRVEIDSTPGRGSSVALHVPIPQGFHP